VNCHNGQIVELKDTVKIKQSILIGLRFGDFGGFSPVDPIVFHEFAGKTAGMPWAIVLLESMTVGECSSDKW